MNYFRLPDGRRIAIRIEGDERLPWLVLSNSLAADYTMWDSQMKALLRRYRVLCYDTRGHGDSSAPEGPYSFDDLVGDVIALLDGFDIDKTAFMGLSLGGMTGLGLALTHPTRVSALVCCDARADAPSAFIKSWDERVAQVRAHGLQSILAETLERWLSQRFREANPDEAARIATMILKTSTVGYAGCAEALKRLAYLGSLDRIVHRTLFVVGSDDLGAPPSVMRDMARRVPGALYREVAGSAHLPNVDNPEGFFKAINDFLGLDR
ncbi:alpha/beta fold hydrolase [Bradyrhizobium sp. 187]|uniref:alpha/beta fold hydrolase n=1 Tax=Bradyrhizobium sp. 187 TaxID=2782655 RepID=UPI001FFF2ADA|nr:alpha/beta fold hydrolase [Bradyrhizobium sp. 187]UPJ71860.1 alpha/beta fold hydrolase [Bradyrhizobium sp. 187]